MAENEEIAAQRHTEDPSEDVAALSARVAEREAEQALLAARQETETAKAALKRAREQLVQSERMASLGQLTAGIAHEIKNPLNFVNNFAEVSVELLDELNAIIAPLREHLSAEDRADFDDLRYDIADNLDRIAEQGQRADSIVRNMLLQSRGDAGELRQSDINALVEESLGLAYHGARANDQGFNVTLKRDFDPRAGKAEIVPQEIGRVLLNLFHNSFDAVEERRLQNKAGFVPTLWVATRDLGDSVEVRVRDNGSGISLEIADRIFDPFFTTKPPGEGTGLGLSLSHDIVVQQHRGKMSLQSQAGDHTEFTIILPRQAKTPTKADTGV